MSDDDQPVSTLLALNTAMVNAVQMDRWYALYRSGWFQKLQAKKTTPNSPKKTKEPRRAFRFGESPDVERVANARDKALRELEETAFKLEPFVAAGRLADTAPIRKVINELEHHPGWADTFEARVDIGAARKWFEHMLERARCEIPAKKKYQRRQTQKRRPSVKQRLAVSHFLQAEMNWVDGAELNGCSPAAFREKVKRFYKNAGETMPGRPKTQALPMGGRVIAAGGEKLPSRRPGAFMDRDHRKD